MKRAGIYIHIPFCRSRCSYCDFATGAYDGPLAERYISALTAEIATCEMLPDISPSALEVDTIYFGGGTPSLLSPLQVERILEAVHRRFSVTTGAEVTMEMNPGTVGPVVLREFNRLGINRASFGAQTFDDRELRRLGRTHTAEDARRTLQYLRDAGFSNISFDAIAGLPLQTLEAWSHNLDEALALSPQHLSLYLLEIHEGTPLADQLRRGMWPQPDADIAAEMYRLLQQRTRAAGYEHYEISNFCRPGYQSRHNLKYWTNAPYYGFGSSAHSYDGRNRRWSNERDAARYIELVTTGKSPIIETIEMDNRAASAEALFLGLRLMRGVDLSAHRAHFGADVREQYADDLARLGEAGLIEMAGDVLRLTGPGTLLSNEVFAVFV